jgi:hypothetical protein
VIAADVGDYRFGGPDGDAAERDGGDRIAAALTAGVRSPLLLAGRRRGILMGFPLPLRALT